MRKNIFAKYILNTIAKFCSILRLSRLANENRENSLIKMAKLGTSIFRILVVQAKRGR